MSSSCFSGDCGFCSGCSGDVGPKVVGYLPPKEFYKMNTGEVPPLAPEPKDPRVLWQKMMYESVLYRIHVDGTWGRLVRRKAFRERLIQKSSRMYAPDGIFWEIYRSHIEFVKGCTEEQKFATRLLRDEFEKLITDCCRIRQPPPFEYTGQSARPVLAAA